MEKKQNENELTGSFALNALGDAEREDIIRDAENSATVREEISGLQETAALLGLSAEPLTPPARVKSNLMATIRNTEQLPPLPAAEHQEVHSRQKKDTAPNAQIADSPSSATPPVKPAAGKPAQRFFALAAGVLLLAAGGLGAVVLNQNAHQQELEQRLDALTERQGELTQILAAADVQSKSQTMDNGAKVTLSYSATEGMMAVTTAGMPELPSDKGYELWLISANGATSAGMLSGSETDAMIVVSGPMEAVTHFGITVEPASGSSAPTTDPILVQEL